MIFGTLGNAFVGEGADVIIGDPTGNLPFGPMIESVLASVQGGELADDGEEVDVWWRRIGKVIGRESNSCYDDCMDNCFDLAHQEAAVLAGGAGVGAVAAALAGAGALAVGFFVGFLILGSYLAYVYSRCRAYCNDVCGS